MSILAAEDSILTQLRALVQGRVRTVETLPGDWDDDMLKRFLGSVPGVWVAFAGGPAKPAGAGTLSLASRWVVYVATGHPSEEARRRGDAMQLGAYALLELLLPNLHGMSVASVGTLAVTDVANLYSGQIERQALTVYAVTLALEMQLDLPADELLAPFETFVAQYDIPPHTPEQHTAWLAETYPPGQVPDARDSVPLPQP